MRSPKVFIHKDHKRGFTLIEILIVIGIMTLLGGMALIVSMDNYHAYAFRAERDTLVSLLQKARSQSMSNICLGTAGSCTNGKTHGVYVSAGQYTVFQGPTYATRDTVVDEIYPVRGVDVQKKSGSLTEVVFSQLSGDVLLPGYITLLNSDGHVSTTTITSQGSITWTN